MTATVTLVQRDMLTALRVFILSLIDCEVIQGLGNGAPMPKGGFIAMTAIGQTRLSTNVNGYVDPVTTIGSRASQQATQHTVQIDCYGPDSGDWAVILSTMLRDEYGCLVMAPNVYPLSADDPRQSPLINAEQQYEARWTVTALLQVNPLVSIPQQFFDAAVIASTQPV